MKIDRFEAHDRLLHFKKDQDLNIFQGAEDCIKKNSTSLALQEKSPYIYIFAHPRTADDGVTKRMLWQPRLSRPKPQTNSYLFRVKSNTDVVEVCWLLPPREMWAQYQMGNVIESPEILWSINQFQYKRSELEKDDPEDLSDDKQKNIYLAIAREMEADRISKKMTKKKEESFDDYEGLLT